ncbi:hypothetical protein GCM10028781_28850 [Nostocoides australiense]
MGAQIDDIADPEIDQVRDIGGGEILQIVGPDEPVRLHDPAVRGRKAAEVPHVHDAVQFDPPLQHPDRLSRARDTAMNGGWRGTPGAPMTPEHQGHWSTGATGAREPLEHGSHWNTGDTEAPGHK